MLENDGAGADGNDGQGGSGAPSGGSPEGGSENDDKPITAKQLKAALSSQRTHYEGRLAEQEQRFNAFKEGVGKQQEPPVEKPKVYTRADLTAAVEAKQITQVQADEMWDRQRESQITEKAETRALEAMSAKTTKERIDADLARYKRVAPEILDASSEARGKIVEEFTYLRSIGDPNSVETELKAIRAVLGPLDKLEKSRSAGRRVESDQQGGGNGDRGKGGESKNFGDKLSPRFREHYQKQIDAKRYPDWKAVEAELKFATPKRRQEMGLTS